MWRAFEDAMYAAPRERQLDLIRAHPDLAGKAAIAGELTQESAREQASAGLDRLSPGEYQAFNRMNREYREKFGLPMVVCVREHTKESILENVRSRLENSRDEEIRTALAEISKISRYRLLDLIEREGSRRPEYGEVEGWTHTDTLRGDDLMGFPRATVSLPRWVEELVSDPGLEYPTEEDRMRLVIELSRLNVDHGTGGPFGAGIFDLSTNRLVAPGVNLVSTTNLSAAHAEMVAIMIAQRVVGHFDLGGKGLPPYELVASTEPCAMCFGATPWSGVRRLACGAREEDARGIGFDEGPKTSDWVASLEQRGISVVRDVCRDKAAAVLRYYAENGGMIYNARQGD